MSVELNWHEGDDQPDVAWEDEAAPQPLAPEPAQTLVERQQARRLLPHLPVRGLLLLLGLVVLAAAMVAALVIWRVNQGRSLARQDIEAVAQLLLDAQKQGDTSLYADLLDPFDAIWREEMLSRLALSPAQPAVTAIDVQRVELDDRRAVAEVVETRDDGSTRRRLLFFYRDAQDGQWRLAPPQPTAFGPEARSESAHFLVYYRNRDEPLIGYLVNIAEGAFVTLCGELRCRTGNRPLVLQILYTSGSLPEDRWGDIIIPSPWIVGISASGEPDTALYEPLIRQLAQRLALTTAPTASLALLQAIGEMATSQLARSSPARDDVLRAALASGSLLPLDEAWQRLAVRDRTDDELAIAEIASLLAFVQERAGNDAAGRLLEQLSRSANLNDLVERALHTHLDELEQEWLDWLDRYLRSSPAASTDRG